MASLADVRSRVNPPRAGVEERARRRRDGDRGLDRDLETRETLPLDEEEAGMAREPQLERQHHRHEGEVRAEEPPPPEQRALAPPVDPHGGEERGGGDEARGEPVDDPALGGRRTEEARHPREDEQVDELQDRRRQEGRADEARPRLAERARARGEPLDREGGNPACDDQRLERGVDREVQRARERDAPRLGGEQQRDGDRRRGERHDGVPGALLGHPSPVRHRPYPRRRTMHPPEGLRHSRAPAPLAKPPCGLTFAPCDRKSSP